MANSRPNGQRGGRAPQNRGVAERGRGGAPSAGPRSAPGAAARTTSRGPIAIPHALTVAELAELLGVSGIEVIKQLMKNGTMANLNAVLDYDAAATVALDLGFDVVEAPAKKEEPVAHPAKPTFEDDPASLKPRPPVVTVMGHVDHGKTSLLDAIRKTNVAAGEAGGITQHIGAYQVDVGGRKVTFIDTPGHEAFTAMRARGAQTTDVAIIVVAADDGVMPQTREAISHAKAAGVGMVVAINKMDRPDANPERVKQQLAEAGVIVEEYGGDVPAVPISARTGQGIADLLETVLLVADLMDLKANPNAPASGTVLEARIDRTRGPMATLLVKRGTLRTGDVVVAGEAFGRIRAMLDDRGDKVEAAGPACPVQVLGLSAAPGAGDFFEVVPDEKTARAIAESRARERQREAVAVSKAVSLEELLANLGSGQARELNVILKTDVQGSIEPVRQVLERIQGDNVRVRVIHAATGAITESDVNLAVASKGIIVGFNVRPDAGARNLAALQGVDIRYYQVIYDVAEDISKALAGLQEERYVERVQGHAEVRQLFRLGRRDAIAGCYIRDGVVTRNSLARIRRGKELVYEGKVASLKRFRDDVREVQEGYECGLTLEDFSSFEVGDIIEFYVMERVAPPVRVN
ncbi:MAG: translation initiation factor IF-2 [Chloroflexota bacterium]|nr:translation initiation factor IF-2 [Dehalococcoidia bacterium]MDW8252437.1 translation initiation factor IF-2 [Chloroflexota bacterium]